MKVRWDRILLVFVLVASLVGVSVVAVTGWTIQSNQVPVTVTEAITVSSPNPVSVQMYPGETRNVSFSLTNASSVNLSVTCTATVTPPDLGVTVAGPGAPVLVPSGGAPTAVNVTVTATASAAPGDYTVTISWVR